MLIFFLRLQKVTVLSCTYTCIISILFFLLMTLPYIIIKLRSISYFTIPSPIPGPITLLSQIQFYVGSLISYSNIKTGATLMKIIFLCMYALNVSALISFSCELTRKKPSLYYGSMKIYTKNFPTINVSGGSSHANKRKERRTPTTQ